LRDHLSLVFGDGGEDVDGEAVYGGHFGRQEVHPTLHQIGDEGDAARQSVELGDEQDGSLAPAQGQSCGQAGTVVLAPAFDILEFGDDLGTDRPGVQLDGGALRVQPEAGLPLLVGADAVVGDEGPYRG
jgi:hypothetical protein